MGALGWRASRYGSFATDLNMASPGILSTPAALVLILSPVLAPLLSPTHPQPGLALACCRAVIRLVACAQQLCLNYAPTASLLAFGAGASYMLFVIPHKIRLRIERHPMRRECSCALPGAKSGGGEESHGTPPKEMLPTFAGKQACMFSQKVLFS